MIPQDLKFTKSHEWIRSGQDQIATVGISEFAVSQLGDIVFLELPAAGSAVIKEAPFCTIESVKAAVEVYAPVDGEIVAVNDEITNNFDMLSEDPYGQGWLVKLKVSDAPQMGDLMSADEYEKYLQSPECQQ